MLCSNKMGVVALSTIGIALGITSMGLAGRDDNPTTPAAPAAPKPKDDAKPTTEPKSAYVLGYTMKLIDGTDKKLEDYKGKVIIIVNTASKCGYTPQYAGLQKLYAEKKDQGFVILAFPANDFGKQEPGSNDQIKEFCTGGGSDYKIQFPLFEKISVKGTDIAPLYQQLAAQPAPIGGEPKWNFTKFLVDRSGNVVGRYEPAIKPDDKNLVARIDELLKAK